MSRLFWFAIVAMVPSSACAQQHTAALLPSEVELELALSAAPVALRPGATVFGLTEEGYVELRRGTNGYSCLVRRRGISPTYFHNSFMSVCHDAGGSNTVMQAQFYQEELFLKGLAHEVVDDSVRSAWAEGRFGSPPHGIAYMLSPVQMVTQVGRPPGNYRPHVMLYAPEKSMDDITGPGRPDLQSGLPYVAGPGEPWSMIVVPMPPEWWAQAREENGGLMDRMERVRAALGT